jgi:hypothetical protein
VKKEILGVHISGNAFAPVVKLHTYQERLCELGITEVADVAVTVREIDTILREVTPRHLFLLKESRPLV